MEVSIVDGVFQSAIYLIDKVFQLICLTDQPMQISMFDI